MSYTGNVSPGGTPDTRELQHLIITKVAVDPQMSNNCYLLTCHDTGDQVLVDGMVKRQQPDVGFLVRPLDADRTWEVGPVGDDALVVTGPVAHLGWWLTGRTPSDQVSSSRGTLPTIGSW